MNNRNSNTPSRERRDSVSDKERRGMQQGYPVRDDATLTFDRPINRPDGPREVPQSMRQGKIPVRKDASTGRTFPVLNRNGQKNDPVPQPVTEDPLNQTEPPQIPEVPIPDTAPEPFTEETTIDPEPVPAAEGPADIPEPTPDAEEPADTPEPTPAAEEPAVTPEPTPAVEEPAVTPDTESAADKTEEPEDAAAPVSEAAEPASDTEPEPDEDEPIEPPLFVQRKRTAELPPQHTADTVQAADPMEATREFDRVPAAVLPDNPVPPAPADNGSNTAGDTPKKLWILPLAAAVLAALGLCIGIPAAMSSRAGTVPDFDMSESYGNVLQEKDPVDETGGAGRDDVPETETEPPETLPPPVKFSVTLSFFDRDPIVVSTSEITLSSLLEKVNYTILDSDRFSIDLSTLLTEETTVVVDTVTYGTAKETVTIPYETKVTNVRTIPRGQKNVTQYGQNGTKTITYTTELVNGVEVNRTVAREEITKQPVTETCQLGIGGTLVGNDGKTYSYSYYRIVNATYYDIEGATYLGYDADESVVAVDMDYIPLGTKIYVKNDQFDFGVRTAADTGSMIEGWEVDIWLDDSNPQKSAFAQIGYVKDMVIYYLD